MTTDPKQALDRFLRLAKSAPEDAHVPFGFQTRVMSHIGSRSKPSKLPFHRLLWGGVATSLACAALSTSLVFLWETLEEDEGLEQQDEIASLQPEFE